MAGEKYSEKLDLAGLDARVRGVLRWMCVDTVEKLLQLNERDFLAIKNCGPKTTAKILQLQAEHGKDLTPQKAKKTVDGAVVNVRTYLNRLIVVAVAANELIESSKKSDRYYIYITKQRFNSLRQAVEILRR